MTEAKAPADRLTGAGAGPDVIAAMLQAIEELVEAHGQLVELVASLQGDVIGLAGQLLERDGRGLSVVRDDARAAQATSHARRLLAEAASLAARAGELREEPERPDGEARPGLA